MYNGIGLQTPRGSGTNGYIQSNKFFVKPRTTSNPTNPNLGPDAAAPAGGVQKANKDILEHDRKRQIELKLLVLQETLADQGYTDSEISEKLDQARKDLQEQHQQLQSSSLSSASHHRLPPTTNTSRYHQTPLRTLRYDCNCNEWYLPSKY